MARHRHLLPGCRRSAVPRWQSRPTLALCGSLPVVQSQLPELATQLPVQRQHCELLHQHWPSPQQQRPLWLLLLLLSPWAQM